MKVRATSRVPKAVFDATVNRLTDGSIGSVERLAGIPSDHQSRFEFWKPYAHIKNVQHCFDAAMAECRRRIAEQTVWVAL